MANVKDKTNIGSPAAELSDEDAAEMQWAAEKAQRVAMRNADLARKIAVGEANPAPLPAEHARRIESDLSPSQRRWRHEKQERRRRAAM